jgi:P-type Ca2+ transporter type 2C
MCRNPFPPKAESITHDSSMVNDGTSPLLTAPPPLWQVLFMLAAVAAGLEAPLTALQILYANIVVDIPPSLALGAEDIEPDAMIRMPRKPTKPILGKRYIVALLVQAASIALWAVIAYVYSLEVSKDTPEYAKSVAFAVIFNTQIAHAFMSRSVRNSLVTTGPRELFLGNLWLFWGCAFSVVAVAGGIYLPGWNDIFNLVPIRGEEWVKVLISVVLHLIVVEIGKKVIRSVKPKSEQQKSPIADTHPNTI